CARKTDRSGMGGHAPKLPWTTSTVSAAFQRAPDDGRVATVVCTACARDVRPTAPVSTSTVKRYSLADAVHVLLWTDARLYKSPADPHPVRAYDYGSTPRTQRPGEVLLARLVEERGSWLKVTTGPISWLEKNHCAGSGVVDSTSVLDSTF